MRKLRRINFYYFILFLISFSCVSNTNKIYLNRKQLLTKSVIDTADVIIKSKNNFEIHTLSEQLSKKIKNDYCIVVSSKNEMDTSVFKREIYSSDLYFEGLYHKSNKVGLWKAYYKNKLVSEIMYVICKEGVNTPVYSVKYDLHGKVTRRQTYNIYF
jgi:hypothetical protein